MFGLLWISLVATALGTDFEDTAWFDALVERDSTLPLLTAANDLICYYFQLNHDCADAAIQHLLNMQTPPTIATFTPTPEECKTLQIGVRPLAREVSSNVFGNAITSATTVSIADFELLTQIWALQVGGYALKTDPTYVAFAAALNSIKDWTTVQCSGSDLEYDGTTVVLPDFVTAYDCNILAPAPSVPAECSSSCGAAQYATANTCCGADPKSTCCVSFGSFLCYNSQCTSEVRSVCCAFFSSRPCCPP